MSNFTRFSIFALLAALSGIFGKSAGGNCTNIHPIVIDRESVRYEIRAGEVFVFPTHNGNIVDHTSLRWNLNMFVERNRTLLDANGRTVQPSCQIPGCNGICTLDPLEPAVPSSACSGSNSGKPCGAIVSHLEFNELDCYIEHVKTDFHGFVRESVFVRYTHPSYPSFKAVSANHLLNGYFDYYPIPNNTLVVNRYIPDSLKISYEIEGYPWGNNDDFVPGFSNKASFLSLWFDCTISISPGNISSPNDDITRRVIDFKSSDDTTSLGLDVSTVFVADQKAFIDIGSSNFKWASFQYPISVNLTFASNICNETLGRWERLEYDPSLSALFTPPTPEDSAHKKKSGLSGTQIAVIATVVPIVVFIIGFSISWYWLKPHALSSLKKL